MNYAQPNKQWQQLNLALSPNVFSLLQELIDVSGQNAAQVIQTGLALYDIGVHANQQGKHLAIAHNNDIQKTILLPHHKTINENNDEAKNEMAKTKTKTKTKTKAKGKGKHKLNRKPKNVKVNAL